MAGIGSGGYDAAAVDYFTRAAALGGDFDRTAINAAYTPAYVKAAINAFVAGCKTDSIWTKLTEVYLLAGVSFGGLMAKLKYSSVATLTNTNFVSGDYVPAGSGAGAKGNGTNKRLAGNFLFSALPAVDNAHLSCYVTQARVTTTGNPAEIQGNNASGVSSRIALGTFYTTDTTHFFGTGGDAADVVVNAQFGTGFLAGRTVATGSGLHTANAFKNGSITGSRSGITTAGRVLPAVDLQLFCRNNNGSFDRFTDSRLSFASAGATLTNTDELNLSLRVNALMTALGANVY